MGKENHQKAFGIHIRATLPRLGARGLLGEMLPRGYLGEGWRVEEVSSS